MKFILSLKTIFLLFFFKIVIPDVSRWTPVGVLKVCIKILHLIRLKHIISFIKKLDNVWTFFHMMLLMEHMWKYMDAMDLGKITNAGKLWVVQELFCYITLYIENTLKLQMTHVCMYLYCMRCISPNYFNFFQVLGVSANLGI